MMPVVPRQVSSANLQQSSQNLVQEKKKSTARLSGVSNEPTEGLERLWKNDTSVNSPTQVWILPYLWFCLLVHKAELPPLDYRTERSQDGEGPTTPEI